MRYLLCLLVSGGRTGEAVAAFERYVTPDPAELYCLVGEAPPPRALHGRLGWTVSVSPGPVGSPASTFVVWEAVASCGCDWVFWLDDAFEFVRPVNLEEIAAVMDANPALTQMALCRTSTERELRRGGYLFGPGATFERRATCPDGTTRPLTDEECHEYGEIPWLEHRSYWTTDPSLFRRELAADLPWPETAHPDGQFGFEVRAARPGATFGVWGTGTPWVAKGASVA